MNPRRLLVPLLLAGLLSPTPAQAAAYAERSTTADRPLSGFTVVVDAGHQLGNASHPQQINRPVDAGGFTKPCNSTGTATNGGYAEATFAFRVATRLRDRLERQGATVVMSRTRNSRALWGPCVDVRGKFGNKGFRKRTADADVNISVHGDGSSAGNRGFHLIVATKKQAKTASTRLARITRRALQREHFPRSTYIGGGTALDYRSDLGTLNLSRFPALLAELGNMRNARDARRMTSRKGQTAYARALAKAVGRFLLS